MAAKFWSVSRLLRRSCFFTCAMTRFSLAIFFRLLDAVPCTALRTPGHMQYERWRRAACGRCTTPISMLHRQASHV